MTGSSGLEPLLVSVLTGNLDQNLCSVYPPCADYGEGSHEILEDCRRYIQCELLDDGSFRQSNLICPENQLFTNNQGKCSDPDMAPECRVFQNLKCKEECPRIHISSSGISSTTNPKALGCYRLKGSKDLNRAAYYENSNKLTLTPFPTNIWISWHITANTRCPYSGLLVNEQSKYVQCPRTQWRGWDVRTGDGLVRDEDIVTRCLSGAEEIQHSTTTTETTRPTSTTTTSITTTTGTTTTTSATSTTTEEVLKGNK